MKNILNSIHVDNLMIALKVCEKKNHVLFNILNTKVIKQNI